MTTARAAPAAADPLNAHVADQLDETARLLEEQKANPFRVRAYRNAASTVRELPRGVDDILDAEGLDWLDRLPAIGPALARVIDQLVTTGRFPMLEQLRGRSDPVSRLPSVPGIGVKLARRLHDEHDIETPEQLEVAAHDGTLANVAGFGEKRIAAIRDVLATRLGRRSRGTPAGGKPDREAEPSVAELLDVDREYREGSDTGTLPRIARARQNPRLGCRLLRGARRGGPRNDRHGDDRCARGTARAARTGGRMRAVLCARRSRVRQCETARRGSSALAVTRWRPTADPVRDSRTRKQARADIRPAELITSYCSPERPWRGVHEAAVRRGCRREARGGTSFSANHGASQTTELIWCTTTPRSRC